MLDLDLNINDTAQPSTSDTSISVAVADGFPAINADYYTADPTSNFDKRGYSNGRSVELITRQLFPVSRPETVNTSHHIEVESEWLNLSVPESGESNIRRVLMDEKAVMPPPLARLKKSRRGPRSRSSQFRGVTFYRRTGRWESHIWYGHEN